MLAGTIPAQALCLAKRLLLVLSVFIFVPVYVTNDGNDQHHESQ
ncbi:hypothetical protein ALFP_3039 [Alcaligenes faecalis]|nr:hypothetical protein ALFP_3039 [Alcaligenes faecalis]